MSGIAGLYHVDGPAVARDVVERMTAVLAHRGGYATCWTRDTLGLGLQSRAAASEPITAGPLALVADARIDNRADLIAALSLPGPASAVTDEALILAAYERWGDECPAHLIGAFAFALWDERRRTLLCARDHLGIRPFYYHHTDALFAFGSEIKAILALGVARRIRDTSVADFVLLRPEDKEATFYEGLLRLPPAHTLTISPDGLRFRRYWALDPDRTLHLGSDEAYADAFFDLFDEAVRCRMRGPATVGSTLSGGLDSSSITVLARDQLAAMRQGPLDTFSLIFDEVKASDERRYIDAALKQGGLRPHYVHGDRISVFEDLDQMLAHLDEPFFGPNLFLHWGLYRSAQQHGVGVLLDGVLGDSVVYHGDVYLTELIARGRWLAFGREVRPTARKWGGGWKGLRYVAHRYVWSPFVAEPMRRTASALPWRDHARPLATPFLNAEFAQALRGTEWAHAVEQGDQRPPRSVRAAHYDELTSGLLPVALEVMDRAVAAFGMEARYPFADRRLVEFCLSLPPTQRFRQGQTRGILRRAMQGHLPEPIRTRQTKGNLSHVLARSLRAPSSAVQEFVEDRLAIASPYLNIDAVRKTYRDALDDNVTGREQLALWQAAVLVRWLERERENVPRAMTS